MINFVSLKTLLNDPLNRSVATMNWLKANYKKAIDYDDALILAEIYHLVRAFDSDELVSWTETVDAINNLINNEDNDNDQ